MYSCSQFRLPAIGSRTTRHSSSTYHKKETTSLNILPTPLTSLIWLTSCDVSESIQESVCWGLSYGHLMAFLTRVQGLNKTIIEIHHKCVANNW